MNELKELSSALDLIDKIKTQKSDLNSQMSSFDKQINDHYHMIELLELNAAELSKVTKSLRQLLKKRREAKERVIAISNFLSSTVETAKTIQTSQENAEKRELKYKQEALLSYEKIFGVKKKVAK